MPSTYEDWIGTRRLNNIGTNNGSDEVAFQGWKTFKEAFAPEALPHALNGSELKVRTLLDPFGGSGTSGLTSQFLGIHPILSEVNPFLGDVIAAKLSAYDLSSLENDFQALTGHQARQRSNTISRVLPPTFVEPGVKGRFLFSQEIAAAVESAIAFINSLDRPENRRFFRVMLGAQLLPFSNVRVSGKGRRYRSNWHLITNTRDQFNAELARHIQVCLADIYRFGDRQTMTSSVLIGDSRTTDFSAAGTAQMALFSPPYPNSFDYTDVYNIELWMLGYFDSWEDNTSLRRNTLSSHVQVNRQFAPAPKGSGSLDDTLDLLDKARPDLWDSRIPEMVGGYFADMLQVIANVTNGLEPRSHMCMIVGDSQYKSIAIPVAAILSELLASQGYETLHNEPFRSMRSSPQHGGHHELAESFIRVRV